MRPPKLIKPYVQRFCRNVVRDAAPVFVPTRPLPGAPFNECFHIVDQHVATAGGERVLGWVIWEWPRVLIEAEFHAVWRQLDGTLIDLTPRPNPLDKILFVIDPRQTYSGRQVDNIRHPLCNDRAVKRLCEVLTLIFKETNAGPLADTYGIFPPNEKVERYFTECERLHKTIGGRYGIGRVM